jgi:hypothetical protein
VDYHHAKDRGDWGTGMLPEGKNTVIYGAGGAVGGAIARTCLVARGIVTAHRRHTGAQALEGRTEEWLTTR